MASTAGIIGLDALTRRLQQLPDRVDAGVKATGEAARYALVWELGRIDINPGPKTMHSTNALGQPRVLTVQAPHGYIRINRRRYQRYLASEIGSIQWGRGNWLKQIKAAVSHAAESSRKLIAQEAPVDSGQLRDSLELVHPGDDLLAVGGDEELNG